MTNTNRMTVLAIAMGIASTFATVATAYEDRVQTNCKNDYLNFCSAHPVGSTGMRRCMEANGKSLSPRCVNALVDAGEIPRKFKR
jgi:hypothetical protein